MPGRVLDLARRVPGIFWQTLVLPQLKDLGYDPCMAHLGVMEPTAWDIPHGAPRRSWEEPASLLSPSAFLSGQSK